MDKINYRMIELARISRKLNQKDLSALLTKINQPNLSKIERGELPVSGEMLSDIAKALDYPESFFYQEELQTPLANLYFRKRATLPTRDLSKILAEIKIILKGIDYLLEDIEIKEYPRYTFNLTDGWTAESVAQRMREILQYQPDRPISNIVTRIEELGIIVYFYNSHHEKFEGLTAYTDHGVPVIILNKSFSNDRLKFTLVHEFFHLVMHLPCSIEPWREPESEANAATSEFFMPSKYCSNDLRNLSYKRLGIIKSYWGISKAAIIRRAKDLDQIDISTYTYLNIELGRRGERKQETGYVEIDKPKILSSAIDLLKEHLGYTDETLAAKMRLSMPDYFRLFEPLGQQLVGLRVVKL